MPALSIRLTKRAADEYVLTCVRPDGSVARQHYRGPTAHFFPRHDLTHYVIETELRMKRGFYGLVAEGWNLGDFGAPWPRGRIPEDADPAENIVGPLDREVGLPGPFTAEEFNRLLGDALAKMPGARGGVPVTEAILERIRTQIGELNACWLALPAGDTMELSFDLRVAPTEESAGMGCTP